MIVEAGKEYNFVFQMPQRLGDSVRYYVVPFALQMGWTNSPPCFFVLQQRRPSSSLSGYWLALCIAEFPSHTGTKKLNVCEKYRPPGQS